MPFRGPAARQPWRRALTALLVAPVLAFGFTASATADRELAMDPGDMRVVELATVGINQLIGAPVVLLREPQSGDIAPITIGQEQGLAILRALEGVTPPRPMTHDLIPKLLGATDARVERVLVDALDRGTYYGFIEVTVPGQDQPIRVDARPSDAMAIAVRTGAEIRVAPGVLRDAGDLDIELPDDDTVVRALGVTVGAATPQLREALSLPDDPGVLVSQATGEAADAGLETGALITSVDGEAPERPMDFLSLVRRAEDDTVVVSFWHDGAEQEVALSTDVPEGEAIPDPGSMEPDSPGIPL